MMNADTTAPTASLEQAYEQRPSIESLAAVTVERVLRNAVQEHCSALARNNTPLRPEQLAVLQDFVSSKSRDIAEDVATPLVRAMKK